MFCILRKVSDTDIITCYRSAARDFLHVGKRVYRENVRHITEIHLLIRREIAYGSPFQVEGFNSPVIALHKKIFTVLCTFHERHRVEFLIIAL